MFMCPPPPPFSHCFMCSISSPIYSPSLCSLPPLPLLSCYPVSLPLVVPQPRASYRGLSPPFSVLFPFLPLVVPPRWDQDSSFLSLCLFLSLVVPPRCTEFLAQVFWDSSREEKSRKWDQTKKTDHKRQTASFCWFAGDLSLQSCSSVLAS
jgi:hypothetical protein